MQYDINIVIYIYTYVYGPPKAFRHWLLAAMATPLQHHNQLAALVPTHRLKGIWRRTVRQQPRGAVKPYIYITIYVNNKS